MNTEKSTAVETAEAKPDCAPLGLLGTVVQRFFTTSLAACPPGLFIFEGCFGFKTEYSDQNGPEAYCVESGEYFWGGTKGDADARRKLVVMPVIIEVPNAAADLQPRRSN